MAHWEIKRDALATILAPKILHDSVCDAPCYYVAILPLTNGFFGTRIEMHNVVRDHYTRALQVLVDNVDDLTHVLV